MVWINCGLDHCGLDQGVKCCQGLEEIITSFRIHGLDKLWLGSLWFRSKADQAGGLTSGTNWTIVNWTSTIWTMTFVQLIHVKFTYCSNDICSIDLCSVGLLFSCQIGQLAWWQTAIVQFDFCSIVFGQWDMFWWLCWTDGPPFSHNFGESETHFFPFPSCPAVIRSCIKYCYTLKQTYQYACSPTQSMLRLANPVKS